MRDLLRGLPLRFEGPKVAATADRLPRLPAELDSPSGILHASATVL